MQIVSRENRSGHRYLCLEILGVLKFVLKLLVTDIDGCCDNSNVLCSLDELLRHFETWNSFFKSVPKQINFLVFDIRILFSIYFSSS